MFGFWKRSLDVEDDPLRNPAAASAWLQGLPREDDAARHQRILALLRDFRYDAASADAARIAAIDCVHGAALRETRRLIAQYIASAERAPVLAEAIWTSARERNAGLMTAYRGALEGACTQVEDDAPALPIAWLLARLIGCLGIDAKLHAFRYQPWLPARLAELNRCYRLAVACEVERMARPHEGAPCEAPALTVEQEYLAVLLAQRIDTGSLAPAECDFIGERVRQAGRELVLEREPRAPADFVVEFDGSQGLVHRRCSAGVARRFLDAAPLVAQLQREATDLVEQRTAAPALSTRQRSLRAAALERAWRALVPAAATERRGASRAAASVGACVRLGLDPIHAALTLRCDCTIGMLPSAPRRAPGVVTSTLAELEALAPPTSGSPNAMRPSPGMRPTRDDTRVRHPWLVVDRSLTGMRLRGRATATRGLAIGSLIAVQTLASEAWALGLVTRLARVTDDAMEAGVALIAPQIAAATLHASCAAREDMRIVVDGVDLSAMGARLHGLYIPLRTAADTDTLCGTLVIPASDHGLGRRFLLAIGEQVATAILREPVEQHGDWVRTAFEIAAAESVAMA